MTRKRYIKLLMALDVSRNTAEINARVCYITGRPYAEAYRENQPWLSICKGLQAGLRAPLAAGNVLGNLSAAAEKMEKTISKEFEIPVRVLRQAASDEALRYYCAVHEPYRVPDGLRIAFSALDEMHNVPGAEMRRTL